MLTVMETKEKDLEDLKRLWKDGDVMKYVGFPEGLENSDDEMREWYSSLEKRRPMANHFSIFEDDTFAGESFYSIDNGTKRASVDIKLFSFARGKGYATKVLGYTITEAFNNGASVVWVDPDKENEKAIALYRRLGFEEKSFPREMKDEDGTHIYMEKECGKRPREVRQEEEIKTERLTLHSYREKDIAQLEKILTHPFVTETFMVPTFSSKEQMMELLHKLIAFSSTDDTRHLEYGIYLEDTLIGFVNDCGIEGDEIEIGYAMDPDTMGHGYATEAVKAVIKSLFSMGFERITAGYFTNNPASLRVMEKCGMKDNGEEEVEEYKGKSLICRYCEIINPDKR